MGCHQHTCQSTIPWGIGLKNHFASLILDNLWVYEEHIQLYICLVSGPIEELWHLYFNVVTSVGGIDKHCLKLTPQ